MTPKPYWKSKTILFNTATALLIVSSELAPLAEIMSEERSEGFRAILLIASVLGNTMLRLVTTEPVGR